jgi:hypothetical protein
MIPDAALSQLKADNPCDDPEIRAAIERGDLLIVPAMPVPDMWMHGGNVPISNVGKDGRGRKGRIGDRAAFDAWIVMARAAATLVRNGLRAGGGWAS